MSRIASADEYGYRIAKRQVVPVVTTIIACLISLLPIVMEQPLIPDFAFLVLIAWRLLRPEVWTAQMALPLGLLNDLIAGHPIGQSMALWTACFLAFDLIDSRVGWRDYWLDWLFASLAIIFYAFGSWYIAGMMGARVEMAIMVPQILLTLLAYPFVARLVLALDRWRLSR